MPLACCPTTKSPSRLQEAAGCSHFNKNNATRLRASPLALPYPIFDSGYSLLRPIKCSLNLRLGTSSSLRVPHSSCSVSPPPPRQPTTIQRAARRDDESTTPHKHHHHQKDTFNAAAQFRFAHYLFPLLNPLYPLYPFSSTTYYFFSLISHPPLFPSFAHTPDILRQPFTAKSMSANIILCETGYYRSACVECQRRKQKVRSFTVT